MKEMNFIDSNTHPFLQEGTKYYEMSYGDIIKNNIKLSDMLILLEGKKLEDQKITFGYLKRYILPIDYIDNIGTVEIKFDEKLHYAFYGRELSYIINLEQLSDFTVEICMDPPFCDKMVPTKVSELIKQGQKLEDILNLGISGKDLNKLNIGLWELNIALVGGLEYKYLDHFGVKLSNLWLRIDTDLLEKLNKRVKGLKSIYVAEEVLNGNLQ